MECFLWHRVLHFSWGVLDFSVKYPGKNHFLTILLVTFLGCWKGDPLKGSDRWPPMIGDKVWSLEWSGLHVHLEIRPVKITAGYRRNFVIHQFSGSTSYSLSIETVLSKLLIIYIYTWHLQNLYTLLYQINKWWPNFLTNFNNNHFIYFLSLTDRAEVKPRGGFDQIQCDWTTQKRPLRR